MNCQKELFSLKNDHHYFNCAYKAPLLKAAETAGLKAISQERNPFEIQTEDFFNTTQQVKKEFAKLINSQWYQIAMIPSVSYGLGTALNNIKGKYNGHAITVEEEFPSGYYALERWSKENQNTLKVISPDRMSSNGENWNNKLLETINKKTSIVLISSIHWMHGLKFDLKAIGEKCEHVGAYFIVDGTQSVGALPIDVNDFKIDALICAGYKWLLGPYSIGLAYFNDKFIHGKPLEESWMNRANSQDFSKLTQYESQYNQGAARYNVGQTSNFILTPMLLAALQQINQWKTENIQRYCHELTTPLFLYLNKSGFKIERGQYSVNHLFAIQVSDQQHILELAKQFKINNIYASVRSQYIRLSVNVFNESSSIDRLIDTIGNVGKKLYVRN